MLCIFSTGSVITKAIFPFSNRNCATAQEDCRSAFPCQRQGTGQEDRYNKYGSFHQFSERKPDKVVLMKNIITICFYKSLIVF